MTDASNRVMRKSKNNRYSRYYPNVQYRKNFARKNWKWNTNENDDMSSKLVLLLYKDYEIFLQIQTNDIFI